MAVCLLACGTANAAVESHWERPALEAARAYWGMNPGCGEVGVSYRPLAPLGGTIDWTTCSVVIDPAADWKWPSYCAIVTHEWGHLLGHGHVPGTIMDPDAALFYNLVPRCHPHARIGLLVSATGPSARTWRFQRLRARLLYRRKVNRSLARSSRPFRSLPAP